MNRYIFLLLTCPLYALGSKRYGDLPENGDTDIPQRTDILKRNFRTLARDDIFDYNNMEYNKRDVGSSPHPTNNKPRTSSGNQNEPTNLPPKIIPVSFESITLETESKSDPLKTKHNLIQNDEYAPPANPKKQENNSDTDDESNKTTKSSPSRDGGNIGVYENFSKAFLRNLDTNHQQNTNPEVKKQENGVQPQRTENEAGIQMETRPSSYLAHSSNNEKSVLKVFGNKVNEDQNSLDEGLRNTKYVNRTSSKTTASYDSSFVDTGVRVSASVLLVSGVLACGFLVCIF